MTEQCKCGVARVGCEYHRPEQERDVGDHTYDAIAYSCRCLGLDDPEVSTDMIWSTETGGVVSVDPSALFFQNLVDAAEVRRMTLPKASTNEYEVVPLGWEPPTD